MPSSLWLVAGMGVGVEGHGVNRQRTGDCLTTNNRGSGRLYVPWARKGSGNSEINTFYFADSETDALPPREISAKDIVAWKALAKFSQSMQVEQISRPRNQHRTLYMSFQAFFAYTLKQWVPPHLLHSLILFDPRPSSWYAP
jgi:hypothetical protein